MCVSLLVFDPVFVCNPVYGRFEEPCAVQPNPTQAKRRGKEKETNPTPTKEKKEEKKKKKKEGKHEPNNKPSDTARALTLLQNGDPDRCDSNTPHTQTLALQPSERHKTPTTETNSVREGV